MKAFIFAVVATLVAGCMVGGDETNVGDSSGNENELAVNEIVNAGEALHVTASSLNLRADGSTSATILQTLSNGTRLECAETSGSDGWVSVKTSSGQRGYVFGRYVVRDNGSSSSSSPSSGGTCDPDRANGTITTYQKALHDSIAYAEGTRNYSQDGYNVLFSFQTVSSCGVHPNRCIAFGSSCSTAAGRYQFLKTTWTSIASARNLGSFEPENQERGAAYLISTTRRVDVPQSRAMTAAEFSNAMSKLSYEWASLPPGRYGQPNKSTSQMRSMYCSLAGC
ncbi:MAG TPA: SH3 domain-containing protein [Kofleriaceae bacterium]|jgi:muramidase (phage lysozyme)